MQPPDTIPFSSIIPSDRIRKTYTGIDELADGILTLGLIHPIILRPVPNGYELVDGGRRYTALAQLETTTLYHAVSTSVGRPGFLLKTEDNESPLMNLLAEISANHDREDIPWQEELPAIVKAWRMIEKEHHLRGESIAMRQFGAMLGVSYHDLQAAVQIYEAFLENPARFAECNTVRVALAKLTRDSADAVAKMLIETSAKQIVLPKTKSEVVVHAGPALGLHEEEPERPHIEAPIDPNNTAVVPLSEMFRCCDSIEYMATLPKGRINHIITDPDYAVAAEVLSGNMDTETVTRGIAQSTIGLSIFQLKQFIRLAFDVVDDHGFCAFWMDLDHWNMLRGDVKFVPGDGPDFDFAGDWSVVRGTYIGVPGFCERVGWRVQRWPAIWRKVDFRSNKSSQHNFTKNIEYAMLLRKPGACLESPQISSVFEWEMRDAVKEFNHPYAKPRQVWRWLMQAICQKGQTVYDPFLGAGSCACAAIEHKMAPLGSEINSDHFANAMVNVRMAYEKALHPKQVIFT